MRSENLRRCLSDLSLLAFSFLFEGDYQNLLRPCTPPQPWNNIATYLYIYKNIQIIVIGSKLELPESGEEKEKPVVESITSSQGNALWLNLYVRVAGQNIL